MIQTNLFDVEPAARTVDACPVCRCCDRVDGLCLGDCGTNGHRIKRNRFAPAAGGWVDLESALNLPYPGEKLC